ncbi:MAG: histidine kinase N-terminal 7TM domain-containing protein, partial [bacterium]
MMNIFSISGILIMTTSSIMAGFMFFTYHESKNINHLLWGIFCVSVAIWGGGGYKIASTTDIYMADAWWRSTHIGIIFIPILFTHFVYNFLNIKRKKFIISLYLLGLFFLATNFFGNLFIANMRWTFNQFYYDSPPGIFYIPFTIMFVGLVIHSNVKLWVFYRKATGLPRAQIKYLLIALVISFSGGSLSFLPVFKIDFYPVLNLLVCLAPIIIAYAITRYQLMDIRIMARKIIVYLITALFSYSFFYFCVWLLTKLFGSIYAPGALTLGLFIAIIFVSLFFVIEKLVRFIANKYFFASLYSQHEMLKHISEKLTTIVDLEKLVNSVSDAIRKTLGVDKIAFILKNGSVTSFKIHKNDGFKKTRIAAMIKNKEIIAYFKKVSKPVSAEELSRLEAGELKTAMINMDARLLLPLLTRNNLQGMIILGGKITSDAYSREDMELLNILASQAALAIENAKLYDQLEEWNDKLEDKVAEQTKDIKTKNVRLKKLLEMKTEFLHTASHQLRTPVSAIKGLVSMLKDGDFKNEDEQTQANAFNGIFTKTEKMNDVLDDILIAEELDTEENYKLK